MGVREKASIRIDVRRNTAESVGFEKKFPTGIRLGESLQPT